MKPDDIELGWYGRRVLIVGVWAGNAYRLEPPEYDPCPMPLNWIM